MKTRGNRLLKLIRQGSPIIYILSLGFTTILNIKY